MHFVLSPLGSAGDVYPFIGLGLSLQARGHDVTLVSAGNFREVIERVGLTYDEVISAEEFDESIRHPDLWHPIRGPGHVFQRCILPFLDRHYDLVESYAAQSDVVMVSSALGFAPRVLQECRGTPLITVHLQPAALWSKYASPQLSKMFAYPWLPPWFKQLQFDIGCRWFVDPSALPALNQFRSRFGLPPVPSLIGWWNSPTAVVGMFPEWYAPPQPDWPDHVVLTDFPCWTDREDEEMEPDLVRFLEAGDRPVVFTPGSAMCFGQSFFAEAAAACRQVGCRALFVTQYQDQLPADCHSSIRYVRYAPFRRLLPHASAIVHHGGIGTVSQAFAAGIPQLLMPMSHDQPDNAARVRRLGVGDAVLPHKFRVATVAPRLHRLLTDQKTREACARLQARMSRRDSFQEITSAIEGRLMAET